jgi:hypothetical protein
MMRNCVVDHMLLRKAGKMKGKRCLILLNALHCNQVSTAEAWADMQDKWVSTDRLSSTLTLRSGPECA